MKQKLFFDKTQVVYTIEYEFLAVLSLFFAFVGMPKITSYSAYAAVVSPDQQLTANHQTGFISVHSYIVFTSILQLII